jgi:hypothetical protein
MLLTEASLGRLETLQATHALAGARTEDALVAGGQPAQAVG